jgi:urease accessory protein
LRLGFSKLPWGTALVDREHYGPLRVQKPFFPEGNSVCHVYVLHPPGGLVQGDALSISVAVGQGAHALLTTPAAGKVYRGGAALASQNVDAQVAEGAVLEWLPQETIVYSGARAHLRTRIDLAGDAQVMAWEIVCLGRPAAHESFDDGECQLHFELHKNGVPMHIERTHVSGASPALQGAWGLQGYAAQGTFVLHPATGAMLEAARLLCHGSQPGCLCSASLVGDTLLCRMLAKDAVQVRERFTLVWQALRPLCFDRPASAPRIWAT